MLWDEAARIVVVRAERTGSTWVSGSEGQRYRSPLVTLRPFRWVKGRGTRDRIRIHAVSDNGCDFGGVGDVIHGQRRELFVIFLRAGSFEPRRVLDSFRRDRALTEPTRAAFEIEAAT